MNGDFRSVLPPTDKKLQLPADAFLNLSKGNIWEDGKFRLEWPPQNVPDYRYLYFLHTGKLKIQRCRDRENYIPFSVLSPGQFFGELSLMVPVGEDCETWALAMEPSEIWLYHAPSFKEIMNENVYFRDLLWSNVIRRMKINEIRMKVLKIMEPKDRIRQFLENLSIESKYGELEINGQFTETDIAQFVNVSPEIVGHALQSYRKQKNKH